jgi:dihydroneopterin aldolase
MADTLRIQDLAVPCRIGVTEQERATPQTLWLDVELPVDAAAAAARDDMGRTVDYARLAGAVSSLVQDSSYRLLETVAERTAELVLREFAAARVRVEVRKKALAGIGYAAVAVERVARPARARPARRSAGVAR